MTGNIVLSVSRACALALVSSFAGLASFSPALGDLGKPVVVGLNADMSTADAESGKAIRLGALVAIEEINSEGGVAGRQLNLEILDHRRNPARGIKNVKMFAERDDVVAILGGKHTPVILAEIPVIHRLGIPYLVPWAAGTPIVDNGCEPNFVFRVSVRDEYAGEFLAGWAIKSGYSRPGLLLENTGWGRSNEKALTNILEKMGLSPARVEWFNWGESDHNEALDRLEKAGSDVVIFVGNSPDGVIMVRSILERPEERRIPIISHWGITGGDFAGPLGESLSLVDLVFLQTFSFFDPPFPDRAESFVESCRRLFPDLDCLPNTKKAPAGVAHAYDLMHLLAAAIREAGKIDREAVRDALEKLEYHRGLVRDYDPPFMVDRHDALTIQDFRMARFKDGVIVPVERSGAE